MGVHSGQRVHIRYQQGHEYLASLPVTGICRHCGTLNDFADNGPRVGPCITRPGD